MKTYISSYGAIGRAWTSTRTSSATRSGVYQHVSGGYAGGHCVSLIGYDDAQGCWIAKNSWGTDWGESGYFKIAYGQCRIENYPQPGGSGASGVQGVTLQAWLPNQVILGLWNNEYEANCGPTGRLAAGSSSAPGQKSEAMLLELAAAKRQPAGRALRVERRRRADLRVVSTQEPEDRMATSTKSEPDQRPPANGDAAVAVGTAGTSSPQPVSEVDLREALAPNDRRPADGGASEAAVESAAGPWRLPGGRTRPGPRSS